MRYRTHKYNARRTTVDGISFDSLKEARRYGELKLLEKAGKIVDLKIHPSFPIVIDGKNICVVELDFSYSLRYQYSLVEVYEDAKGFDTAISKLKRKLVEAVYGFKVELI